MNEGSYNNVVRSNSPFSPMTPSTPNTYKTNVNRTKTRKWVEAKVQSYDGDDWGNEYEDDYGEPEPEPAPRVAALRHQGANTAQQPRAYSQSSTDAFRAPTRPGPLGSRDPSGPPSLHIQTAVNPGPRPVDSTSSAQSQSSASSRFPPRDASRSRQNTADYSSAGAPRSGTWSGSNSGAQPWSSRRAASPVKSSSLPRLGGGEGEQISVESSGAPAEDSRFGDNGAPSVANTTHNSAGREQVASFGSLTQSDAFGGPKQTLASVEGQKPEGGKSHSDTLGAEMASDKERAGQRGLSSSPKLPDLARMSGFGDDFFSTPGGYNTLARPSLSPVPDAQPADVASAKPDSFAKTDDKQRDTADLSEQKHPSSILDGPKLEPNPQIIMPPLDGGLESKKSDFANTSQHSAALRPQLPGTWVSETISTASEHPTPTESAERPGPAFLGTTTNPDVSPMSVRHAEPADLEPTTAIRQLPSKRDDSEAIAEDKAVPTPDQGGFNDPTGKHDEAVTSKVIAAGPGYHPTPHSLPPLKTDNSPPSSNTSPQDKQEPPTTTDMGPSPSRYRDSLSRLSSTQHSVVAAGPGFTPTAPLNPRRSVIAPADLSTPVIQERKSTMSTVDTTSPEKESDKLREEIIKSLSASPATTPGASAVLGSPDVVYDPAQSGPTRESTYLSGVYDDYLAPIEDKSLQETGLLLKQGSTVANHGTGETETVSGLDIQKENAFPDIAPLSPRRSPELETARRERRFSWENGREKVLVNAADVNPGVPSAASDAKPGDQIHYDPTSATGSGSMPAPPNALQVQPENRATISHQVSDVSSRAPGGSSSVALESPSPISFTGEKSLESQPAAPQASRLSFAEEKEQAVIQSSLNASPTEQHPALAQPIEFTPVSSPAPLAIPTSQSSQQSKVMAFRDILNIVSIEQRIQKFDETRAQFYSMDTGLSNWIAYMQSQPEHGAEGTVPIGGRASSAGGQAPAQQPYQQYLNTSSPEAPAQRGRALSGNLHMFTGQPMSGFGSSGAQVGVKSKELLQAAGAFGNKGMKSGMKLFNKGKNKLRGTGDKAFF